jgi:hypothetical protein
MEGTVMGTNACCNCRPVGLHVQTSGTSLLVVREHLHLGVRWDEEMYYTLKRLVVGWVFFQLLMHDGRKSWFSKRTIWTFILVHSRTNGRDHDASDSDERRQTDKRQSVVWERRRVEIRSDNCIALQPKEKGKDTRSAQVQNKHTCAGKKTYTW